MGIGHGCSPLCRASGGGLGPVRRCRAFPDRFYAQLPPLFVRKIAQIPMRSGELDF